VEPLASDIRKASGRQDVSGQVPPAGLDGRLTTLSDMARVVGEKRSDTAPPRPHPAASLPHAGASHAGSVNSATPYAVPHAQLSTALRPLCLGLSHGLDAVASRRRWRRPIAIALEAGFGIVSVTAAAAIVYSGEFWRWPAQLLIAGLILIATKLAAGLVTGALAGRWRYVGLRDAATIARSALIAGAGGLILLQWLRVVDTSVRLVGADTALYVLLSGGTRLGTRWLHEWARCIDAQRDRALRERARVERQRGAAGPAADRGGLARDGDEPRGDAVFRDHDRSRAARAAGGTVA
jgi:hypothetical protein